MKFRTYLFQTTAMIALIMGMSLSAAVQKHRAGKLDKKHSSTHHHSSSDLHNTHFHKFKEHSMILSSKGHGDKWERSTAINPHTKKPFVFWFVDNTRGNDGDGTFESPFNTLIDAQNSSLRHDIIYVLTGTGTDYLMNAGIALQQGQKLLGAGISQHVNTTLGNIKIPAQSKGLPVISNTLSTYASTSFNAVFMDQGDNEVSGFTCVDNLGGGGIAFPTGNGLDTSGGIKIAGGLNYLIKNNILSSFGNPSTPMPGGNGLNLFGGGNVTAKNNTFIGRDQRDTYGLNQEDLIQPMQGFFVYENNLFTGADTNSGLDIGILVSLSPLGAIGNLSFSIVGNTSNSQTNIASDSPSGILIIVSPNALNSMKFDIKDNNVTIPAGILNPLAGIDISAHGPGPVEARLHNNVSITPAGIPGYRFKTFGNPGNLNLDLGSDNVGTVTIIP